MQENLSTRILVIVFFVLTAAGPLKAQKSPPSIQQRLNSLLQSPALADARIGIVVENLHNGEKVFALQPTLRFNPASLTKVITTAAALYHLGAGYSFTTALAADSVDGARIKGNLYLLGGGDPDLKPGHLWELARTLLARGITSIEGDLVVDDSRFAVHGLPPVYDQKQSDSAYRPSVSAAAFNFDMVEITVQPGPQQQSPCHIILWPTSEHTLVTNECKTVTGKKNRVKVTAHAEKEGTRIAIKGTLGDRSEPVITRRRVDFPSLYTAQVLAQILKEIGVEIKGSVKRGRMPTGMSTLASHESKPLAQIIQDVNKWSNNFMAEMLLLGMAAKVGSPPGTFSKGYAAIGDFLDQVGIVPSAYKYQNGSGLYDANEFSPESLAMVLRYIHHSTRLTPELKASLAIGGMDGTLKSRLAKNGLSQHLRGKTGTLDHVAALGGYVTTSKGNELIIVVLINEHHAKNHEIRAVMDSIAAELITSL